MGLHSIEIYDRNPFDVRVFQRVHRTDRYVVKQAESHCHGWFSMVTRRAYNTECIRRLAGEDLIDREAKTTATAQRGIYRTRVYKGVTIQHHLALGRFARLNRLPVLIGVYTRYLFGCGKWGGQGL